MHPRFLLTCLALWLGLTLQAQTQLTNLPTVYINTFGGKDVTSKTEYLFADFTMVSGLDTLRCDSLRIRGRGNASWTRMNAKKPYKIKFSRKVKLLGKGYANAKNWILLAQADDKSFIRNAVTWEMTRFLEMPYSPGYTFVDLYLNGEYRGNYMLCDKIDIRKHRVDIYEQELPVADNSDEDISGGYLCEVDGYTDAGDTYFQTSHAVNVRVHSPEEDVVSQRQVDYIRSVVQRFEDALYSTTPTDYRQFVDMPSFLAWYIAGEVSANIDAYWSVYFFKERLNPLLYWGPLWDEDLAYNNTTRMGDVTEELMADVGHGRRFAGKWIDQLKDGDTGFWPDVATAYRTFYNAGLTDLMVRKADSLATLLRPSAMKNFEVWDIGEKVFEEFDIFNTYDEYVDAIKRFVTAHNAYLLAEFDRRAGFASAEPLPLDTAFFQRLHILGDENYVLSLTEAKEGEAPTACIRLTDDTDWRQQWQARQTGGGNWLFINRDTGLALSDYSLSTPYSYQLVAYPADTTDTRQQWQLSDGKNEGCYNLVNSATARVADNRHSKYADFNEVISYTASSSDDSAPNRLWCFEATERRGNDDITSLRDAAATLQSAASADYQLRFSPTTGRLRFVAADPAALTFTVSIHDVTGRLVRTFLASEGCSVADLPVGTYIASWSFAASRHSTKFRMK
ncbi:MAG: CotH kinase family protein [Bacteroidaceae bacterium]|nr:CotH kinase family protein [Bacteroidaceae bacterium]